MANKRRGFLGATIDPLILEKVKEKAIAENRSLSNMVETMLKEAIAKEAK